MAINQTAYVDLLVKKLLGVAKTDLPGNKSPSNESIASPLLNRGDKTWTQAANIPTTAAAVANIVQAYTTTSIVECTGDNTTQTVSSVYPTWKTGLANWIPPEFDTVNGTNTYRVAVYYAATGAAASFPTGFTQIFADGSGGTGEYHFDYQAGTVNFIGGTIPSGMSASSRIYVVGYRYIGLTGVINLPSITLGTGGAQGTLTTNGAYNLLLNTNAGSNSGTITIAQGVNGNITLTPNGTGNVVLSGHPTLEGVTATGATGTGKLVFDTSPTLVTPVLGIASATTINKVTLTAPATGSTLTIAEGKTLTASNTLTFTGTDSSSVAFGSGGTVTYTSNKLSVFSATTSAELASVISDETGTGLLVFATAPTFTTSIDSGATFGAFASSTALTVGYTGTATSTTNISTGAVATATTKTINIGTGGDLGSTTIINIGNTSGGPTSGSIIISNTASRSTEEITLATVASTPISTFPAASFRSGKLIIQAYNSVNGEVQISELLVAHNGVTATATEYGIVFTGTAAFVIYEVDLSSGNVRLMASNTTANSTQYKISKMLMVA